MSKVIVQPGICGLKSEIIVTKKNTDEDSYLVEIKIESESDNIKNLAKVLKEVDGLNECFNNFSTSKVYRLASEVGLHLACPVPCGIIKAIEVECGLALSKDVEIIIT